MKRMKLFLWAGLFNFSLFCGPALHAQSQSFCGQNLVPNPGFEDYSNCPTGISEVDLAVPWFQPTDGTSDYFNSCGASSVGVPSNEFGTQPAHGGQAYAGGWMYAIAGSLNNPLTVREYIEVPLLCPLNGGHSYAVSFYVSLASISSYAIDNVGAYLSAYPLTSTSYSNLNVTPQVRNPAGSFLNSANWTLIQGTFTAVGGESYLTIGNFYDNAHTPLQSAHPTGSYGGYYYIDDVSVTDTTPCNTSSNNCITIFNPGDITATTCSNSLPVLYCVGATDGCCSNFTLTTVPASGFNFPVGTTIVTSTVTDNCGNADSGTFTVTVVPSTNPPIIYGYPTNVILCGSNGCGVMPDATSEVQALTATGGTNVVVTQNIPPGTIVCSDTNVIFTVADDCGNATNCTVPCILSTNLPAIIYCPTNVTICINSNGCAAMPDETVNVQATNSLAGVTIASITQSIPPGTLICDDTNITFTVTDTCGNATNCTVPCDLIDCASNCLYIQCWTNIVVTSCTNLPVYYNPTVTDACCSNLFAFCSPPSGSIFDVGTTQTVTFVALDDCGNSNNCTFTVTVEPGANCTNCLQIQCWTNVVVASCTNVPVYYDPTAIDTCCSNWGIICSPPSGSEFAPDTTNTVTCVATDLCGNVSSCTFTVTVLPGNCTNCCPITLSPGTLPSFTVGVAYNQTITASGNCALTFYGTTGSGGGNNDGTVFSVTTEGTLTTLVSFNGANGESPEPGLTLGSDGNFYGTTYFGGASDLGTVFKMTPGGSLTTLATFTGPNGAYPSTGLAQGSDGNFYGTTTYDGGSTINGTVFKMTPGGALTTLVIFNVADGEEPQGELVQGSDGNFYGTTYSGGSPYEGTVFLMTPGGSLTTLVAFNNANGSGPAAGLVQGSDGNFYGTTYFTGSAGDGIVFKMMPVSPWTLTTLVTFTGPNGAYPTADLIQGSDGNFYGTTDGDGNDNDGTVFKMTPSGTLTTLATFTGPNGALPYAGLVQGSDGNFYGTTSDGGSANKGTVFQMTPSGTLTTLATFTGPNGALPSGGLVQGSSSPSTYTFVVTGGSLPPGLTLSSNGTLSGTPTMPGGYCFTVTATDPNGCTGSTNYCLTNTCLSLSCSNLVIDTCDTCTNVSLAGAVSYSDPCCSNNVSLQYFEGTNSISPTNTCFPVNTTNTVVCVATDLCGNVSSCSFTVTVEPAYLQVQTPDNIVIDSCTNVQVTYPPLVVNDPCCGTNWNVVYDPPSGTSFPPNTHTLVNWFLYDCVSGTNFAAANSFLVSVDCTNCCEGPITNYTVTVVKGSNYLADCLCQGMSNTLADVLPSVPVGTQVYFWNPATGAFDNPPDTFSATGWSPGTEPLVPGEGFLLVSFTNQYSLTIYGIDPGCGPSCTTLGCGSPTVLVGDYGLNPNPADFCDLFCCVPPTGTEVRAWNASGQSFTAYTYNIAWLPSAPPALPVGYSEFVSVDSGVPDVTACPTNIVICTNGDVCGPMPDARPQVQATESTGITQSIAPGTIICSDTNVTFTITNACGYATNCVVPVTLINCGMGGTVISASTTGGPNGNSFILNWNTNGLAPNFWQVQYSTDLFNWTFYGVTNPVLISPFTVPITASQGFYRLVHTN